MGTVAVVYPGTVVMGYDSASANHCDMEGTWVYSSPGTLRERVTFQAWNVAHKLPNVLQNLSPGHHLHSWLQDIHQQAHLGCTLSNSKYMLLFRFAHLLGLKK